MVDEAQVAQLYQRYGHALYRRCLSLVGDREDARELLQEAFCQFWRGRDRFQARSSAFTYLYRIATNLSIDRLRRRRTAGEQVDFESMPVRAASSGAPDRRPAAVQELAELTGGLDEETLVIAVLSHIDGMTQDEIAAALDLSRRTVGKRLKRFAAHTRVRAQATAAPALGTAGVSVNGR